MNTLSNQQIKYLQRINKYKDMLNGIENVKQSPRLLQMAFTELDKAKRGLYEATQERERLASLEWSET